MPTFIADYLCENCGETSEILTHNQMKEDGTVEKDLVGCPHCGSLKMTQVAGGHGTKLHDRDVLAAELKKRSADHTLKDIRKKAGWKTGALPPNFGRTKQY